MKVTEATLKSFIYDMIMFEDAVDGKGNRMRRSSFRKEDFKAFKSMDAKLKAHIEVIMAPKEIERAKLTEADLVRYPSTEYMLNERKLNETLQFIAEAFTDGPDIEFTPQELKVLRGFFEERDSIKDITIDLFEKFEELIK